MIEALKLLLMFVNETDTWNDTPLYHAIVHRLRQMNIAGATAIACGYRGGERLGCLK